MGFKAWWKKLMVLAPLVRFAYGESYCDTSGICYEAYRNTANNFLIGFAFPTSATGTEFVGTFVANGASTGWLGVTLGPGMNQNLIIVAWPNNGQIVFSARVSSNYALPTSVSGYTITTISSAVTSSSWRWTFRCQGCTSWTFNGVSGSINQSGTSTMGYGYSTVNVNSPSDPNSSFGYHSAYGLTGVNIAAAHFSEYSDYLNGHGSGPSSTRTSSTVSATSSQPSASSTGYDYIVIGGGTSGLIAFDRLSETGKKTLLIERGPGSTWNTGGREQPTWLSGTQINRFDVPGLFESLFSSPNPWWWCTDVSSFAGCLMGGGSAINALLYYLPPDIEFSSQYGWPAGWTDPSNAITKLTARLPSTDAPSTDGKRYLTQVYDVVSSLLSKQGFTGLTVNDNRNSKSSVYGRTAYNSKGGKRTGVMGTYYVTATARPNASVLSETTVIGLVRNGSKVTGVRITKSGSTSVIALNPNGRVVLAAGAFGTPKILFLSGIGPSDMLSLVQKNSQYGPNLPASSQWINLPVGNYASDNPSINVNFAHPSVDAYDNWSYNSVYLNPRSADAQQYKSSQAGVFAESDYKAVFWKPVTPSDGKTRYLQGTVRPGAGFVQTTKPYNATQTFTIIMYLTTGITSRGRVGIDSDMKVVILTKPWLVDQGDRDAMVQGIQSILNGVGSVPNLTLLTPDSASAVGSYVDTFKQFGMNSNHWVGTARLGTNSSTSVVDSNAKVWNTDNLFIVDGSIIPAQPMANTHGSIMVVAEMAVEKILALAGGP